MLETNRLYIREWTEADDEALHIILSDALTLQFWPQPFTYEETQAWIACSLKSYAENGYGRYALVSKETGELIGDCGIMRTTSDGEEVNDIGYIIHHPCWRQGYATEAATAVRDWFLAKNPGQTLHAKMAHDHTGSQRVAERLGMKLNRTFNNSRNRNILTHLYVL